MFGRDDQKDAQAQVTDENSVVTAAPPAEPVPDASLGEPAEPQVYHPPSSLTSSPASDAPVPHLTMPTPSVDTTAGASTATTAPTSSTPAVSDELVDIKQEALQELSPLIGHLDQTAEEKFRTTMMLIQATDDQTKIKDAYEAAKQITDEKVRAQALLDVVNEINYFTQQHQEEK